MWSLLATNESIFEISQTIEENGATDHYELSPLVNGTATKEKEEVISEVIASTISVFTHPQRPSGFEFAICNFTGFSKADSIFNAGPVLVSIKVSCFPLN